MNDKHRETMPIKAIKQRPNAEKMLQCDIPPAKQAEMQFLIHELELRRIGLETQNNELQQANAELKTNLEQYTNLYESAPVGYLTLERNGVIRQANLTGARMLGFDRNVLLTQHMCMFVSNDFRPAFNTFLERVFRSHVQENCEVILRKDGSNPLSVLIVARASRDGQECIATLVDITASKREDDEKYMAVMNMSLDGFLAADTRGRILRVNDAYCRLSGYSREDLQKMHIHDLEASESQKQTAQLIPKVIETGYERFETIFRCKDGRNIDMEVSINYVPIQGGVFLLMFLHDITARKQTQEALRENEERFRATFEQAAVGITHIGLDGRWLRVNQRLCDIVGYTREELLQMRFRDITHPEDLNPDLEMLHQTMAGVIQTYSREKRYIHKDGSTLWVNLTVSLVRHPSGKPAYFITVVEDISKRKQAEEALRENVRLMSSIIEAIPDVLIRYDCHGLYLDIFTRGREKLYFQPDQLLGRTVNELWPRDMAEKIMNCLSAALKTGRVQSLEFILDTPNHGRRELEARYKASGDNEVVAVIRDITVRKNYEKQLKHLSMHDQLTGLYNRTYFEEEIKRLQKSREYPISMITVDLDGLKLINDTLGHSEGDRMLVACADVFKRSLRASDILARIGGDEFAAILPHADEKTGENVCDRLRDNVARFNQPCTETLPLSLSIGVAYTMNKNISLTDVLKQADDLMYRDKLSRSAGARNKIIEALMAALAERDFTTEGHTRRLAELCQKVGKKCGITSQQLSSLALLSQTHDLGKVGIPDHILFKKEPLTEEEWEIMRMHPEKGYRIAAASPDLSEVADLIMKHHERWDGRGYPLGLIGKEIPVECRILAVVDAYDAMTNDRPYSKAIPKEEALQELKRCAGSQFDPEITGLFFSVLEQVVEL